jgi:hypothetical protein
MFDKAMRKSIESHLEPGEELLEMMIVQGKGMTRALVAGGVIGASAIGALRDRKARDAERGEVELANKMGLAITSRRVLIFKAGGAVTLKATELLTDLRVGEVESLVAGKGAITKPLTMTVHGEEYRMEAPRAANTDKLVKALAEAKSRSAALT